MPLQSLPRRSSTCDRMFQPIRDMQSARFRFQLFHEYSKDEIAPESFIARLSHEEQPIERLTPPHRRVWTSVNLWLDVEYGFDHLASAWMAWYHGCNMESATWKVRYGKYDMDMKGTYDYSYAIVAHRARREIYDAIAGMGCTLSRCV